jgi:hypothetical protein
MQKNWKEFAETCIICGKGERINKKTNTTDIALIEISIRNKTKNIPVHLRCFNSLPDMPDDYFEDIR